METHITMEINSWECLMKTLLRIKDQLLCCTDRYNAIKNPEHAGEIADILTETVFYTCIRSGIKNDELWLELRLQNIKSSHWLQTISQWAVKFHYSIKYSTPFFRKSWSN